MNTAPRPALFTRALENEWDVLVIGGGITGAGIFREATRHGLSALLVDQRDFAWGTSSRSSKLVHGGLRYLGQGKIGLTRDSVRERERLAADAPGLVKRLGFLLPTYQGDQPSSLAMRAGLSIYDLLALNWTHRHYGPEEFRLLAPRISADGLEGGFRFGDAQTDDARLVLRVLQEGMAAGGTALNYAPVLSLERGSAGVSGAVLLDSVTGCKGTVKARAIFNATGAWADQLRSLVGGAPHIRPLRGSHLVFPAWRFPLAQAISFYHPADRRPIFAFPWEGASLVGTTDVDHGRPLDEEPSITPTEAAYLLSAVESRFPGLGLSLRDVITSFSGVRPVVGTGKADPSKESREHVIWNEDGLVTVTGGKLTTFRLIALDALKSVRSRFPSLAKFNRTCRVLDAVMDPDGWPVMDQQRTRLLGRYGAEASTLVETAREGDFSPVAETETLWAEIRWAARREMVVRLEDLLLRRVRLGLLLPLGASALLPRIREICSLELGWTASRFKEEEKNYLDLWEKFYRVPSRGDPAPGLSASKGCEKTGEAPSAASHA